MCLKRTKINKKEAGVGPFKKNYSTVGTKLFHDTSFSDLDFLFCRYFERFSGHAARLAARSPATARSTVIATYD